MVLGHVVAEAGGIRSGGNLQSFLVLLGLSDIISSLDVIENTEVSALLPLVPTATMAQGGKWVSGV